MHWQKQESERDQVQPRLNRGYSECARGIRGIGEDPMAYLSGPTYRRGPARRGRARPPRKRTQPHSWLSVALGLHPLTAEPESWIITEADRSATTVLLPEENLSQLRADFPLETPRTHPPCLSDAERRTIRLGRTPNQWMRIGARQQYQSIGLDDILLRPLQNFLFLGQQNHLPRAADG